MSVKTSTSVGSFWSAAPSALFAFSYYRGVVMEQYQHVGNLNIKTLGARQGVTFNQSSKKQDQQCPKPDT
jgi:hypothetical protein